MDRIVKISRVFCILLRIIFFLVPLWSIVNWVLAPAGLQLGNVTHSLSYTLLPVGIMEFTQPLSVGIKLLGFCINLLTIAANMLVLEFLIQLFKNYQQKNIFSLTNARLIRNVGYTMIVWQLLMPVRDSLTSILLTWQNGPGHRLLITSFNSNNVGVILIACIVVLVSWVMVEGSKLQEEHDYTV
jgi:hypothetical protein